MNSPKKTAEAKNGLELSAYLLASRAIPVFAPALLRRRLKKGKEHPLRWREKLGEPSLAREDGAIVWLHAVGLGEVMALRGLIAQLSELAPDLRFLVTSTARSSAVVFAANLPSRCQHQFLPLDAPSYLAHFMEYWRPAISIWAEQDIWPGAITAASANGVPLALVNARLTQTSYHRRMRFRRIYADLLSRFSLISAQDEKTVVYLHALGAEGVRIDGAFKAAAPRLRIDPLEIDQLRRALKGRRIWVAASTHEGDEVEAILAAQALADRLLILVPRDVSRAHAISEALTLRGLPHLRRSAGGFPAPTDRVWIADSYGELGLWYSLAEAALIGGSFDMVGGHNPWEAAALGAAILHGPDVSNFEADYSQLHQLDAARTVAQGALADALLAPDLYKVASRAMDITQAARGKLEPLARGLLSLMSREC
jgi:3-deoxy-D-manno-octulosonic-acid transferase